MNLILIGLRGSGKTTAGRLAADLLGRDFTDLDEETARLLNAPTVAEAWRERGEPAFRRAEVRALRSALARDRQIVALGGGTPTAPGACELLRAEQAAGRARVLYLWAPAAALRERLRGTDLASRPSLTGADPLTEIEHVLAQRDDLYRTVADLVITTEAHSPDEVAMLVRAAFSN
jgi:shikimate kinase